MRRASQSREKESGREITGDDLITWYQVLHAFFGHQGWWPSKGWFETIIGAILAQNVSWSGASQAVRNLDDAGLLSPESLQAADSGMIATLIRSSRYYNQKTERILTFLDWFMKTAQGDIRTIQDRDPCTLRKELLALKGFGPETVDSILLYACNIPVFVVDAYTRRIGVRNEWFKPDASYDEIQTFFMERLPLDTSLFNDFHAQIVVLGNRICRTRPDCDTCPLASAPDQVRCSRNGIHS